MRGASRCAARSRARSIAGGLKAAPTCCCGRRQHEFSDAGSRWRTLGAAPSLIGLLLVSAAAHVNAQVIPVAKRTGVVPDFASLTPAKVTYDAETEQLTIELPPTDLPAATST